MTVLSFHDSLLPTVEDGGLPSVELRRSASSLQERRNSSSSSVQLSEDGIQTPKEGQPLSAAQKLKNMSPTMCRSRSANRSKTKLTIDSFEKKSLTSSPVSVLSVPSEKSPARKVSLNQHLPWMKEAGTEANTISVEVVSLMPGEEAATVKSSVPSVEVVASHQPLSFDEPPMKVTDQAAKDTPPLEKAADCKRYIPSPKGEFPSDQPPSSGQRRGLSLFLRKIRPYKKERKAKSLPMNTEKAVSEKANQKTEREVKERPINTEQAAKEETDRKPTSSQDSDRSKKERKANDHPINTETTTKDVADQKSIASQGSGLKDNVSVDSPTSVLDAPRPLKVASSSSKPKGKDSETPSLAQAAETSVPGQKKTTPFNEEKARSDADDKLKKAKALAKELNELKLQLKSLEIAKQAQKLEGSLNQSNLNQSNKGSTPDVARVPEERASEETPTIAKALKSEHGRLRNELISSNEGSDEQTQTKKGVAQASSLSKLMSDDVSDSDDESVTSVEVCLNLFGVARGLYIGDEPNDDDDNEEGSEGFVVQENTPCRPTTAEVKVGKGEVDETDLTEIDTVQVKQQSWLPWSCAYDVLCGGGKVDDTFTDSAKTAPKKSQEEIISWAIVTEARGDGSLIKPPSRLRQISNVMSEAEADTGAVDDTSLATMKTGNLVCGRGAGEAAISKSLSFLSAFITPHELDESLRGPLEVVENESYTGIVDEADTSTAGGVRVVTPPRRLQRLRSERKPVSAPKGRFSFW
eukprot:scaffold1341_cov178-Amphora_coffeaeformis.AAC.27